MNVNTESIQTTAPEGRKKRNFFLGAFQLLASCAQPVAYNLVSSEGGEGVLRYIDFVAVHRLGSEAAYNAAPEALPQVTPPRIAYNII